MKEFRRWYEVALCTTLIQLIYSPIAYTSDEISIVTETLSTLSNKEVIIPHAEEVENLIADTNAEVAILAANIKGKSERDVYTINFNNISIIELIRFTSKLTNLNFVFQDADLQFTVTVVSEEAVTARSMMAALSQVLRMHDLVLLEQGSNVLITKSTTVHQVPPIISADTTDPHAANAALITRVFRIKNANVNAIANIIRPMISQGALVEVSTETRQLIVTDIATNVDQIAILLNSLDAPHSPLDVETFVVKNIAPIDLIALTEKILSPFTEGNPLIFVPQPETNSVYIVSTPFLIDRAMTVMEDLDIPGKAVVIGKTGLGNKEIFIYKPLNRSPEELIRELNQVSGQLKTTGGAASPIDVAIESVKEIKDTGSLMFVADAETFTKLKAILTALDTAGAGRTSFYIYKIQRAQEVQIAESLKQMDERLQSSPRPDQELIEAIGSMKWIKETNSLVFTGSDAALKKLSEIVPTFDVAPEYGRTIGQAQIKSTFLVYNPKFRSGEELKKELDATGSSLKHSGLADPSFLETLDSMKWISSTNSLIFTGDPQSIQKIHEMLESIDTPTEYASKSSEVFIYKPQYASPDQIQDALKSLVPTLKSTHTLSDQNLASAIDAMQWNVETQSFMVTSETSTIARLKTLLTAIDTAQQAASPISKGFFLYKLQHKGCQTILDELKNIAEKMPRSSLQNQQVITTIHKIECIKSNNSLLITGTNDSMDRVKALIAEFDVASPTAGPASKGFYLYKLQNAKCDTVLHELKEIASKVPTSSLQNEQVITTINKIECIKSSNSLLLTGPDDAIDQVKALISEFDVVNKALIPSGSESFLIYKPKYVPAVNIQNALTDLSKDLQASGLDDPQLLQTLSTMRYVKQTDSLLFTGSQENLDKVQNLISGIDTSAAIGAIQNIGNITFLLYKIQSASPEKLISSLKTFAIDLKQSNVEDKQLAEAINGVKWIRETNSLLFTGNNASLEKVEQLVKKFDIPSLGGASTVPVERAASTFLIYNPKYLSGDELISILCEFMDNLMSSGVADPGLFDTINNLKWIDKTSSLLISGDPQSVEKVDQLLIKFDIPSAENAPPAIESIDNTSFLIYKLQYHPGNDIQNSLRQVAASLGKSTNAPATLVDAINSLQWIEITNSLLCTGQQEVLVKLKDLIQSLDIPLRQVFIEVLVIETALNNQQNFGLMWGGQVKYLNKTILQSGNFPLSQSAGSQTPSTTFPTNLQGINGTTTPTNTSIPFTTGFDLGVIGDIIMHKGKSFISLGSLLNAIQLDTDSTVILNPKIITQDNRQSTVFVGQNIPYTGAIVTNASNSTVTTSNIEYRDVGVALTITPILGDDNVITMDIVQDISQVTNSSNVTTSTTQLTGIQTNHTHMETRVHVPDNHFVALTGMINDSKTHFRTSIPCLGGLPVIGALFSENDRNATKNNIIVFVRPQIITSYQEYKKITEHQEWLFKDTARLPVLKEEFDEGIDMVKLPENE